VVRPVSGRPTARPSFSFFRGPGPDRSGAVPIIARRPDRDRRTRADPESVRLPAGRSDPSPGTSLQAGLSRPFRDVPKRSTIPASRPGPSRSRRSIGSRTSEAVQPARVRLRSRPPGGLHAAGRAGPADVAMWHPAPGRLDRSHEGADDQGTQCGPGCEVGSLDSRRLGEVSLAPYSPSGGRRRREPGLHLRGVRASI
jgi:hypothetical protein